MLKAFWETIQKQLEQWKQNHAVYDYEYDLQYVEAIKNNTTLTKYFTAGMPDVNDDVISVPYPKSRQLRFWAGDTPKNFKAMDANPNGFTEDNVTYTFNAFGFRGEDVDVSAKYKVLVIGDSHTFGVGLDDKQTWTHQFKTLLPIENNLVNLSIAGASMDYISRALLQSIDTVKPDIVIVCYTYDCRRETQMIATQGKITQINPSVPDYVPGKDVDQEEFKSWFMTLNNHSNQYNFDKNREMVKLICHKANVPLIESTVLDMLVIQKDIAGKLGYLDKARDSEHFGPHVHKQFAKQIYEKWTLLKN